jgi:lipoate---protein ligase
VTSFEPELATGWAVERATGPASAFHARPLPARPARAVWVHEVDRPALVLGSAQPPGVADAAACEAAGVEVVRRRSGGGAVLLAPGEVLWVDVVLPAGDALWDDDVGRAAGWLGEAWASALAAAGAPGPLAVHRGPMWRTRWSDLVCFAGRGPGEVTDPTGAKVVGISQRRTRSVARFQCAALGRWDPGAIAALLAVEDRSALAADLAGAAAGAGGALGATLDAFLAELPA